MSQPVSLRYEPRLIEEAVFFARKDKREARELQRERDRLYEVTDPEERERLFGELNRSWFIRLGLDNVIEQALQEQPLVQSRVKTCFLVSAAQRKEEGAELFVASDNDLKDTARRTLRILIRPESLLKPHSLRAFLRHELFHIADMLDPVFAYEPALPKAEGGPTYDTLIANRYRVLWDVTINGRMARRGWISESVRDEQRSEFLRAFPMLEAKAEKLFGLFFDGEQHSHSELTAFALDPRAAAGHLRGASTHGMHCPLCRFPTHDFEPEPDHLGDEIIAAIRQDFPRWRPGLGLCAQCADLYRANQLSSGAAKQLPGWR